MFVVLVVAVTGGRWLFAGKHGEDCTSSGMCSLGHLCIESPYGLGKICAQTCDEDAECASGHCVGTEGHDELTGWRTIHVFGADHVCVD